MRSGRDAGTHHRHRFGATQIHLHVHCCPPFDWTSSKCSCRPWAALNVAFAVARHSHPPKALATADTVVVVAAAARIPTDSTCVVVVALVVATFHADTWDSVVVSWDHVRNHHTCWPDSCIVVAFGCGVVRIVADRVVHRTRGCCKEPYYRYITFVVAYSVVVVASLVAAAAATHIARVRLYIALALMAFVAVVVVVGRDHDWADASCRDWHVDCMGNVQDVVSNRNCAVVVAFAFD